MAGEKYFIRVSMKVQSSFIETARFSLGTDQRDAMELFNALEGELNKIRHCPLRIDLIMEDATHYATVASMGCSLNQFLSSSKTIIKESFRIMNLSA